MKHIKKLDKKSAKTKEEQKLKDSLKKSGSQANVACPELAPRN